MTAVLSPHARQIRVAAHAQTLFLPRSGALPSVSASDIQLQLAA
jgi:hypothetical protein